MIQAFRNRKVGLLFGAQVISIAGDMVLFVALPFWVFQLTGSAMATGIMFAALTIPQLLISPLAGVFVDRLDRKRLMIISDLLRAGLVSCYLLVNTADQVWIIYLLAFAESAVSQFFRPSVTAVVPTLVEGEEELTRANAALGASFAVGQLAGPALGGVIVTNFGPHAAALFDAGTYLLSAGFVLFIHIPHRESAGAKLTDARKAIEEITRELLHGVRVVLERPVLRVIMGSLAVLFLAQGVINVLLIVVVSRIWHAGAQELGWVVSGEGLGGIIGTIIVGGLAARFSPKQMIVTGGIISGLLFLIVVNQPSVYVAIGLILLSGIAFVGFNVGLTTLLQLGSDDANRGRVSSLMQTVMAASQLLSIAATTLLADSLGPGVLLNIAGGMFMLGGLVALLVPRMSASPMRSQTATPQPAE